MRGHHLLLHRHHRHLPQPYVHGIQKLGQMSLEDREHLLRAKLPPILEGIAIISDIFMTGQSRGVDLPVGDPYQHPRPRSDFECHPFYRQ